MRQHAPILTANLYVEQNYMGYCTVISNKDGMSFLHRHNYYEVFLVFSGSAVHYVNGEQFKLEKGALVLIRPDDEHCYRFPISDDYQIINFILTQELMQSISRFLGPGFARVMDTTEPFPQTHVLSGTDRNRLVDILEYLMLYPRTDVEHFNTVLKITAIEVLNCFIRDRDKYDDLRLPLRLRQLITEMHKEENYTRGLSAMYEISQYSPEHLCRLFRKYLNVSPTTFLATIRLEEAARRLIYTDEEIIDIASSVGFDNLSYFYRRFKEWNGMSPRKYRETSRNVPKAQFPDHS